jgi:hypothetical protein
VFEPDLYTPPDGEGLVRFELVRRGEICSWGGRDRSWCWGGEGEAEDVLVGVDEGGRGVFLEIDILNLKVLPFQVDNPTKFLIFV